jgi:hypothetical protein
MKTLIHLALIPQPLLPEREKGSRSALSGLLLAHFWERGTEGVRAYAKRLINLDYS